MLSWKRLSTTLLAIGAAAAAGCGDNTTPGGPIDAPPDIDGDTIDAEVPDAEVPDATPAATRGMTVAVSDVTVTTPGAAAVGGVRGGSISMTFSDLTTGGGEVLFGTSPINGCVITQYDPTHVPSTLVDALPVTVTDVPAGDDSGLLKTVGPCTFQPALGGYVCISHLVATGDATIVATNLLAPNPAGAILYTMPAAVFPAAPSMIGSYLRVGDFTDNNFDSPATGAFPVVNQNMTTGLVVVNPAGELSTTETITNGNFTVLNGFAPVPAAGAAADFLGLGGIRVQKPADDDWGAIDVTVAAVPGEGFALDDDSSLLHAFPTDTAAAQNYECDGVDDTPNNGDDTCGAAGTASLKAMIISGRATKKSLTGLQSFQMPTEIPGTDTWIEWQCAFLLARRVTFPVEAVQEILDFEPTRVEMRALFVGGAILDGPTAGDSQTGRVLVGHALVGHTDFP